MVKEEEGGYRKKKTEEKGKRKSNIEEMKVWKRERYRGERN